MRQLKHHEKKLLRKVDLYSWKNEDNLRVAKILRRYHIQNREDYTSYTRIVGMVTKLSAKLKTLKPDDPFRVAMTDQLLTKLSDIGLIHQATSLKQAEDLTASSTHSVRILVALFASNHKKR